MSAAPPRRIPFGRPWITDDDRKAVLAVLDGPILTHGPQATAFEAEFAEFLGPGAHCVAVSSGMAALHLAWLHFGLGPGDEVIVPAQTHAATANAVEWVGARPVFVDCDPATGNVTPEAVAAAITPRTRAIALVHFVGIPCDMPGIMALAAARDLRVVEDCAIAVGTRLDGRHVGLFGDAGCFSFYPVKHITTGEGGMFVTRHPAVAGAVGRLRAHGVDRTHFERAIPGVYDVVSLGLNYRLSELQAALGRTQLRRIDEILERRRANFTRLRDALRGRPGLRGGDAAAPGAVSSHYCLSVVLDGGLGPQRDEVVRRLNAAGVGTSVYYPQPVPRMRYYREKYGYDAGRFPHAAAISDRSIALPVAPHVSSDDVDYIADTLPRVLSEVS
jgi:perosamine synthetase